MQNPMRFVWALFVMSCIGLFLGCASWRVTTDYDPRVQFSAWKTYAWLPDQPGQSRDPRLQNDLLDARTRISIERALAQRGFDKATKANADFLVTYYISLETRIDVQTLHRTHRYSRRGWSGAVVTSTRVDQYEVGTFLLDVLEPTEWRLVWRGSTSARIRQRADPIARSVRIDEAVQAIMERFPPQ